MQFWVKKRKGSQRDERGVAVLELAVVLPVLLVIGLGVIEFGNYIYQLHLVGTGVRDAARYLSGIEYNSANITKAKEIAAFGAPGGTTSRVPGFATATVTIPATFTGAAVVANNDGSGNKLYRGGSNIYLVTVSASVPYSSLGFLGFLKLGSLKLKASHQERHYGIR